MIQIGVRSYRSDLFNYSRKSTIIGRFCAPFLIMRLERWIFLGTSLSSFEIKKPLICERKGAMRSRQKCYRTHIPELDLSASRFGNISHLGAKNL